MAKIRNSKLVVLPQEHINKMMWGRGQTAKQRHTDSYREVFSSFRPVSTRQQLIPCNRHCRSIGLWASAMARPLHAHNLGSTNYSLSQYVKVSKYFQQALPTSRSVGKRNGEAAALTNLGVSNDSLSQYVKKSE